MHTCTFFATIRSCHTPSPHTCSCHPAAVIHAAAVGTTQRLPHHRVRTMTSSPTRSHAVADHPALPPPTLQPSRLPPYCSPSTSRPPPSHRIASLRIASLHKPPPITTTTPIALPPSPMIASVNSSPSLGHKLACATRSASTEVKLC